MKADEFASRLAAGEKVWGQFGEPWVPTYLAREMVAQIRRLEQALDKAVEEGKIHVARAERAEDEVKQLKGRTAFLESELLAAEEQLDLLEDVYAWRNQ